MAAFADSSDMIARYDPRSLGDLCSDDGESVPRQDLATNPKMTAALSDATGQILAALLRGGRYTRTDLDSLTAESQQYLKKLTCTIAFWNLWDRKPYMDEEQYKLARDRARETLDLLAAGKEVFDVTAVIEAGHANVDTITRQVIHDDWELMVDTARNGRFYPRRRSYRNR